MSVHISSVWYTVSCTPKIPARFSLRTHYAGATGQFARCITREVKTSVLSSRYKELQCIRVNDIAVEAPVLPEQKSSMDNNMARATFSFTDVRNLERGRMRLSKLGGIHSVDVSLLTQMVAVEYDPQEISLETIRNILKRV